MCKNMRMLFLLPVLLLVSIAVAHEDTPLEDEFVQASDRLSTLLSAGKSAEACVKSGNAAIHHVIKEKSSSQTVLNRMPNGSKCKSRRSRQVKTARTRVTASGIAIRTAETNLRKALAKKVSVSVTFSTTNKKCNTLYKTRRWISHRLLVKKLKRLVSSVKARLSSAKTGVLIALRDQRKAQCRCKAAVTRNANAALKSAKKLTASRKRTIRREKLLICLAQARGKKNANILVAQCKTAALSSSFNRRLALHRTKLVKMRFRCEKNGHRGAGARQTNDKCKGFFVPKSCNGHIAFELMKTNTWSRYTRYKCPLGWKWASWAEYNKTWKKVRSGGFGKKGKCTGYGYYGRCGWKGYPAPNKYYFRFSDSRRNCKEKHAGNYIANTGKNCGTGYNAGLVCIKS